MSEEALVYDILFYDIRTGQASAVLREWAQNKMEWCLGLVYVPIETVPFYRWEILKQDGSRAGSIITGPNPREAAMSQLRAALLTEYPKFDLTVREVSDCYACGRD